MVRIGKVIMKIIKLVLLCFLCYNTAYAEPIVIQPILPNPVMTPGDTIPGITREKICLSGYTGSVRNVTQSNRISVFVMYFLDPRKDRFEVDHLISLELGGSNDVKNLWPQSYTTKPWNAHVKDKLENRLHNEICDGILTVEEAQEAVRNDWIKTYCEKFDDLQEDCAVYLKGKE